MRASDFLWDAAPGGPGVTPPFARSVKEMGRLSMLRPLLEVGLTWGVIGAVIAAYVWRPTPWMFAVAFVVIASRQYALLILMHEAFHALIHPDRRVNDFVGAILIGAPCGSAYWQTQSVHLRHHRKLGEHDDPEFFLHCASPPRDKRSLAKLGRHFLLLMLGGQVLYTHFGGEHLGGEPLLRRVVRTLPRISRVAAAQLILLLALSWWGSWTTYVGLWLAPLLSLAVLFNGVRAFCDHANVADDLPGHTRRLVSYVSTPVERFFLAPYHMNYHAEHHLFPYVPHYRLPSLRRLLMASPDHRAAIQWRSSYLGFVRNFLRAQRGLPPAAP